MLRLKDFLAEARNTKLTYTPIEVKGKLDRLVVNLTGSNSAKFSNLTKQYIELEETIESLTLEKKNLNVKLKDAIMDLYDAEDEVLTRVVETISFTATLSKKTVTQAQDEVDYAGIVVELTRMVPELSEKIAEITKAYTKAGKAKEREPSLRVDVIKEGVMDTISKFIFKIKSWVLTYDERLAVLKSMLKGL